MREYIEKQAAIDAAMQYCPDDDGTCSKADKDIRELLDELEDLPVADVAPVVHGRWLLIVSYNNTYKCSECGRLLVDITDGKNKVAKHYPYCHCGAKMDGERKE